MPDEKQQRINFLRKMILELAKGNFQYRIELSGAKDTIEDFGLLLNMLAEELGFLLTHQELKLTAPPLILIYDQELKLVSHSIAKTERQKLDINILLKYPLNSILLSSSLNLLEDCIRQFSNDFQNVQLLQLRFSPTSGLSSFILQGMIYLLTHHQKKFYMIQGLLQADTSVIPFSQPSIQAYPKNRVLQLQADIQKIRNVHQFILNHLHESLPSLIQLSRQFNLNEYKLKKGFKQLYQTTIFKFHLQKRLEQSLVLIQNTPMSLKTIAASFAFKSFPHFSRAFKKKYGVSPSSIRKQTQY